MVCFLGAHYITYIKGRSHPDKYNETFPIWKLYDDYKPVDMYMSWKDIIEKILDFGNLPTVLIYEKVNEQNKNDDINDSISFDELAILEKKAISLQQFIDQFENEEA